MTPIIKHRFNWQRLNVIGAIASTVDGQGFNLQLQVQQPEVDSNSIVTFLKGMLEELNGQIYVIWDGLPAHRSRLVKEFVATQDRLSVTRLPAYAPELNPVEYLWAAMKNKDMANCCANDLDALEAKVESAYNRFDNDKEILTGCLKGSKLFLSQYDST